jgi:hypothetical protein
VELGGHQHLPEDQLVLKRCTHLPAAKISNFGASVVFLGDVYVISKGSLDGALGEPDDEAANRFLATGGFEDAVGLRNGFRGEVVVLASFIKGDSVVGGSGGSLDGEGMFKGDSGEAGGDGSLDAAASAYDVPGTVFPPGDFFDPEVILSGWEDMI